MKVLMIPNKPGLIIIPETEFESQWLRNLSAIDMKIFHKCGVSASEYIGLKLTYDEEENK